jgi:hypothetical protein
MAAQPDGVNRLEMKGLPPPNPIFPPGPGAAGAGSKSNLKGVTRGDTSVDVCAHGGIVVAEALVCARQRPPQFPLHPYR